MNINEIQITRDPFNYTLQLYYNGVILLYMLEKYIDYSRLTLTLFNSLKISIEDAEELSKRIMSTPFITNER